MTAMGGSECLARMQAYYPKIVALAAFDSTPGVVSYTRQA
jgi:hypothetical protein